MPDLARSIVSLMRQFVGDRRRAKRMRVHLPFTLSLLGPVVRSNGSKRNNTLSGHTLDLSATGIALVVPTILLGEHHLLGENRNLSVRLELPDGPIEMRALAIRYESLDEHKTETGYLIGAKIVELLDDDRQRFNDYVAQLAGR